jgi:hypothetical protein
MHTRLFLAGLLLLPVAASAFIKEAVMQLPETLAAAERLSVTGRQGWKRLERLHFGPFSVHDVDRSLTKGGDLRFGSEKIAFYEGSKRRQTFGFLVSSDGILSWRGAAATNLHRRALERGIEVELKNQSGFAATLSPADGSGLPWILELTEKGERPLAGALKQGARTIEVAGTNRLAGSRLPLGDTTGYVFREEDQVLAAVQTLNNGAVWLAPDLSPDLRGPLIAAISALLLFEELRPTLPE